MSSDKKDKSSVDDDTNEAVKDAAAKDEATKNAPGDNVETSDAPTSTVPDTSETSSEPGKARSGVPEPQNDPAPVAVEAQTRRPDGFARLLAVIAIILAFAVYGLSQRPEVPSGSAAKLQSLQGQVADLANRPTPKAEADPAADARMTAAATEISALQQQISNLSGAIASLEAAQHEPPEVPDHSDTLATLDGRVSALESRPVPDSQPVVVATGAPNAAVEAVQAEVQSLGEQLENLKGRITEISSDQSTAAAQGRDEIAALETRLRDALDSEIGAVTTQLSQLAATARAAGDAGRSALADQAALLLAVGQLRDASSSAQPFSGAWGVVTSLGVTSADYQAISNTAPEGVATLDDLVDQFRSLGSRAIVASQVGEDESWVGGALKRVGNLVKVRRTGDVEGDSVEAIIARAEARLAQGDASAALTELDSLDAGATSELSDWRAQLTSRLALNAEVKALQQAVLDSIAAEGN